MGVIYRPAVMLRIVEWGRKRGMHIIVDELYALSTHKVRNNVMCSCFYLEQQGVFVTYVLMNSKIRTLEIRPRVPVHYKDSQK